MNNKTGTPIAGFAATIEFGAHSVIAAQICHAHLTLIEMVKKLVLAVARHSILVQVLGSETQVNTFECHSCYGSRFATRIPIPHIPTISTRGRDDCASLY